MIAPSQTCVEPKVLADLAAGRLPAERFASVLMHIESCPRCMLAVEQSDQPSSLSWLGRAATVTEAGPFSHEPECEAVLGHLLVEPLARRATATPPALPTETLGPYRLLRWLGSGGMGAVYLAEHQRLKRLAAIKLLPREKLLQTGWLERFNREMTSIAALEHPHVVRAMDAGDEGGWHFLVMEYLDGLDLSKLCRRTGPVPLATACELVRQAALGLSAIHGQSMTHRDIKPSNLFLTKAGTVKLLDLGLVLSGDSPLVADERLTTVGHLMGTLPYMAREQLSDASRVDWRADIYSLGATFFHLLTGRAPFGSVTNLAQMIQKISSHDCPPLQSIRPEMPQAVADLVDAMLSHDPAQRPPSAQHIADSLLEHADSESLVPMLRVALSREDHAPDTSLVQSNLNLQLPAGQSTGGQDKSRGPWWVALMLLPLAFMAGIWLMVMTDQGTLVIESDQPGVAVKVSQGDKVVEALRIEKQPSVLRLSSGKYVIEVSGAEGDDWQISESQVALLRGDKQVVKISKRPASATGADPNNVAEPVVGSHVAEGDPNNLYQGKPLSAWMAVFEREKDVGTLSKAMQALQQLAESEQEKYAAARTSLLIARRLGGMIMTGRPETGFAGNPSGWYMTELVSLYPQFFPEPGFQAIVEELEQGNERSGLACILLLSSYPHNNFNIQDTVQRAAKFAEMAKAPSTQAQLERMNRALNRLAQSLTGDNRRYLAHVTTLRYELTLALKHEPAEDPELVAQAKEMLAQSENQQMIAVGPVGYSPASQRSALTPGTALMLSRILPEQASATILAGFLEINFDCSEEDLVAAFSRLAERYPRETAAAVTRYFVRSQANQGGFGLINPRPVESTQRAKIAMQALLAHPPETLGIIKQLMRFKELDMSSIFSAADIESLLREFAHRLAGEPEDGPYRLKLWIAGFLAAQYGLVADKEEATIERLLQQYPRYDVYLPDNRLARWNELLELTKGGHPAEAYTACGGCFDTALRKLFENYPAEYLKAYARCMSPLCGRLEKNIDVVSQALTTRTPPERRLLATRTSQQPPVKLVQLIDSPAGDSILAELEQAYSQLLQQVTDTYEQPDHPGVVGPPLVNSVFHDLNEILLRLLTLAEYRKQPPAGEAVIDRAVKILVTSQTPTLHLGIALRYADEHGYETMPLRTLVLVESEIAESPHCDKIKQLVQGLHSSRPQEFCRYFCQYLEQFADRLDKVVEQSKSSNFSQSAELLFGGLDAKCDRWYHDVLSRLLENPETKARTQVALRRIIKRLAPGTERRLEEVLPKE